MNKLLLAATAFGAVAWGQAQAADAIRPVLVAPTPVAATDPFSGYLELYGLTTNDTYWSDENPWPGLGGAARVNWWINPTQSLQLDFQGSGQWNGNDSPYYYSAWNVQGFGHWSMRSASHLIGVFGGLSVSDDADFYYSATSGALGIEGQLYHNNLTLYGQVGVWHVFNDYDVYLGNMTFANAELRWFVQPNTKLSVNAGYSNGHLFGPGYPTYTVTNWGAEAEQKLGMSPFSLFARYDQVQYTYSGYGTTYTASTFKAGMRFVFDQPTLLAQDRKGATLKVDLSPIIWAYGADL